ncbi:Exopolyphosphatase [Thermoplasmatales archaeon BRNA1]|nr:Exopolyphosphatase [Thermoplasmatales archaeon BRNA1]
MDRTAGFIDVGTNSVHMLVVRFYEGSLGTPIYQDKEAVRLGKSLYGQGKFDPETIEKTRVVLSKFKDIAEGMGVEEIVAYATCAAREAPNASELLDAARKAGVDLRIISGLEEARLTRLGVVGPDCARRTLLMDIGGGSTEVTIAEGRNNLYMDSMSLGAVRFAYGEGFDPSQRITPKQYDFLRRQVDTASYRSVGRIRDLGFEEAIGSSGTLMALAAILAAKRGDDDASYIDYNELKELMKDLCRMTAEERSRVPKLSSNRAEIIIGGGAVAEELMFLFGISRLEISPNGLREGMRTEYLLEHDEKDFDIRSSSVVTLAARCGCDTEHSEAVAEYAARIYDSLCTEGVFARNDRWRSLLGYAAQLHDVGEFISYEDHADFSYLIIRNAYLAGFDNEELEAIAQIARMHHSSMPGQSGKGLSRIPREDIPPLVQCALILKVADILDRGRDRSIDSVSLTKDEDSISMHIKSKKDISMVVWKLKSVSSDFKKVFGRRLAVYAEHGGSA